MRTIKKIITGQNQVDGAGVRLVRVFGYHDVKDFDPFLMLDAFDSKDPDDYTKGFPWHPHRGIETVTYLIEGEIEHGDSLGNGDTIFDGECQWMTAGSGIIHQEMPKASNRMLGVQLWINLPAKDKMTNPKYRGIKKENIPVIEAQESNIKIISGNYNGTVGALQGDYIKPLFLDVELKENCSWSIKTENDATVFIYVIQGEGCFEENADQYIGEKHAILFNHGNEIRVNTSTRGVRFLFLMGKTLNEPIAWGGPIVMNTREELDQAFREIDEGTFIKIKRGDL